RPPTPSPWRSSGARAPFCAFDSVLATGRARARLRAEHRPTLHHGTALTTVRPHDLASRPHDLGPPLGHGTPASRHRRTSKGAALRKKHETFAPRPRAAAPPRSTSVGCATTV